MCLEHVGGGAPQLRGIRGVLELEPSIILLLAALFQNLLSACICNSLYQKCG